MSGTLPPDWQRVDDPSGVRCPSHHQPPRLSLTTPSWCRQQPYYWNTKTNEVQWSAPSAPPPPNPVPQSPRDTIQNLVNQRLEAAQQGGPRRGTEMGAAVVPVLTLGGSRKVSVEGISTFEIADTSPSVPPPDAPPTKRSPAELDAIRRLSASLPPNATPAGPPPPVGPHTASHIAALQASRRESGPPNARIRHRTEDS